MSYLKTEQKKNRRGSYFKCETCGEEFYVFPSYIKKSAAKNVAIRYCSRACYKKEANKNPFFGKKHSKESIEKMKASPDRSKFLSGELNPNFKRFGAEYGFRGSRSKWWRKHLIKTVGKCEKCGFEDSRILNLHHINRDRSNNTRENLALLCWNCHALEHYEAKDGFYHFFKQKTEKECRENRLGVWGEEEG